MNTIFGQILLQADGRYLTDQELQGIEGYVQTYAMRNQTYQILANQSNDLVLQALRQFALAYRQEVETHGAKCKRDMEYALKCISRAVLMDEPEAFQQDFALWMDNITHALHKGGSAAQAYRCLKAEVQKALPAPCAILVVPYLDGLIDMFSRS